MTIISSRDFRSNQGKYLSLAAQGESVILTSRSGNFKIVPVGDDDAVMTKADYVAKINAAMESIENGHGRKVADSDELQALLDRL